MEYETYDVFNLSVPKTCAGVPDELLNPKKSWTGTADFSDEVTKLGELFNENFKVSSVPHARPDPRIKKSFSSIGRDLPLVGSQLAYPQSLALFPTNID